MNDFFFPENQSPQINVIFETQGCRMNPRLLGGCSSLFPSTVLGASWASLRRVELNSHEYVSGLLSNSHIRRPITHRQAWDSGGSWQQECGVRGKGSGHQALTTAQFCSDPGFARRSLGVQLFLLSAPPGISWGASQAISQNEGLGEGFPGEERRPLGDTAAVVPRLAKSQRTLPEGVWGPGRWPWANSLLAWLGRERTAVGFLGSGAWWRSTGQHGMPPVPLSLGL